MDRDEARTGQRDELEAMAEAGRQQRAAEAARRAEADGKSAHADQEKKTRARDAVEWRFAQRASRAFDVMVDSQIVAFFVTAIAIVFSIVFFLEEHGAWMTPIVIALGGVAISAMATAMVRIKFRDVLATERAWALEKAFGMVGHIEAIGEKRRFDSSTELTMTLKLNERMPKAEVALFSDAVATLGPEGSVEEELKTLRIMSGKIPVKRLAGWNRAVVEKLLPQLARHGIEHVKLESPSDSWYVGDDD